MYQGWITLVNMPPQVEIPVRLMMQFQDRYPNTTPQIVLQAPDRDIWVLATINTSGIYALDVVDLGARTVFTLHSAEHMQTVRRRPLPRWAHYPAAVLLICDDDGISSLRGVNAVIGGNEPRGPRYTFALGVAFAALIFDVHGENPTGESLVAVTDRARRHYVEQYTIMQGG